MLRALGLRAAYARARRRLGGVPWRTRRFLGTVLPEPVKKPIKAVLRLLRPPADGPATAEPAADESPKAAPPGPEREQRRAEELAYWRERGRSEDVLANSWFESLFTRHFGLEPSFYAGKAVLDVGCGPRGSLEWAGMASRRVGLDPLAHRYVGLGLEGQDMSYVSAAAEAMPFCDGSFDVVSAFNSLDHVDDLGQTVRELVRVLRPGGLLLLIVDVNHEPTVCEPQVLSWDVLSSFGPRMRPVEVRHLERHTNNIYANVERPVPFDHEKGSDRRGVMVAMLEKVDDTGAEREGDR
ncbi:MAG: class I SAM-dependent methyltransferase [Candidatus Brocadiia bacterium]